MKKIHLFRLIQILIAVFLVLFSVEIITKFIGYTYAKLPERNFTVEPNTNFFIPHKTYGYSMQPGRFSINQDGQLKWTSTQDKLGYRICSLNPDTGKPEIWIFGCSFTYGWGVSDNETYPWLLQEALPDYAIKNYGVGGYGTLHAALQLSHLLENKPKDKYPKTVVLSLSSFHMQRNTASPFWMRSLSCNKRLEQFQYPYARIAGDSLTYGKLPISYTNLAGSEWLNIISIIEFERNRQRDGELKNQEVTARLVKQISAQCKANDINLLLLGLDKTTGTYELFGTLFNRISRPNILIAPINLNTPEYTFLPNDPHPNQKSHQAYAQILIKYFNTSL